MDNFQPEYIEADEVIQVDGNYYGIFNVSGPDYNLPLIVFVDALNYFNNGQPPNVPSFTKEQCRVRTVDDLFSSPSLS